MMEKVSLKAAAVGSMSCFPSFGRFSIFVPYYGVKSSSQNSRRSSFHALFHFCPILWSQSPLAKTVEGPEAEKTLLCYLKATTPTSAIRSILLHWPASVYPKMGIKFFPILFSISILAIFCNSAVTVCSQCLNDQRDLLLNFKNDLNSASSVKLGNWTRNTDCCLWKGVFCDQAGHVTGLHLNSQSISGAINQSSGLFGLQFLERLNLAYNSFNSTQIPTTFGSLTNLAYLNLSNAGFGGQIPVEISRLTRLVTLDLSTDFFVANLPLQLSSPNLATLIQNLRGLKELYLDGVNISAPGREWCQAISSTLPNLEVLSLSNCNLSGPIDSSLQNLRSLSVIRLGLNNLSSPVPGFLANFTNLKVLTLSASNLNGPFPQEIFQVPTLQTLDLSSNGFLGGFLPGFRQNGNLQKLVVSYTNFSGRLPDSIGYLTNLSWIELDDCNFTGPIPNSMADLTQLVYVDLSSNRFTGPIPSFQRSKNLIHIDLSRNALAGPVPSAHFEGLPNLVNIDLAYNSLNGSIPSSLFSLPSLQRILLSNNQFGDPVPGFQDALLSQIQLDTLDLSSNKLGGPVPTSFFDLRRLRFLSLSFNNFTGTIKLYRLQGLKNLTHLDLSYNNLSINAGDSNSSLLSFPHLSTLKLASSELQKFPALMNQSRMTYLDLSDNQISGEIPSWIWNIGNESTPGLQYLNLSCNHLVGLQRPYTISPSLGVLDLHSNLLGGEIPVPSESAVYVDYSGNNFSSSIPDEIGDNLNVAYFFSLSKNNITGAIPQSICNASYLRILDLSNNRLSGNMPHCLIESSTKTLGVLNLHNNSFSGNISATFPKSCPLETLDFSGNHLEGLVPKSLESCKLLEVLNLGDNKINDKFPCFLKNSSSLRVLVLRSNKFHGPIGCQEDNNTSWPKLQIIDLALNNFSGVLPGKCFSSWKAMMGNGDAAQSDPKHLHVDFLNLSHLYYQDTVRVTAKGLDLELEKILTIFTSIDFSSNKFQGGLPDAVGALKALYVLNLSQNALTGQIPSSFGNLAQLGSLDLSQNNLNGTIPAQLATLTFLSVLNLSNNHLVGKIPVGNQFQTFPESSFEGNIGLCGNPLNTSCKQAQVPEAPRFPPHEDWPLDFEKEMYLSAPVGYVVGFGSFMWSLELCKRWKQWYYKHVNKLLERIFHLEETKRRGNSRHRAYRDPVRRL